MAEFKGLAQAPVPKQSNDGGEFPKWVTPDESHIVRQKVEGAPDHVSTPGWPEYHVNRVDGSVTVLVKDADEEARALAAAKAPEPKEPEPEAKSKF